MTPEEEVAHAKLHLRASAHAEASVYSLNNPYLIPTQKAAVEAVYQFPLGAMSFAFGCLALAADQSLMAAYLNASFIGALAWALASFGPTKLISRIGFITGGWVATLIDIALAAWAAYEQRWAVAGIMATTAFGITSIVMSPTWLWSSQGKGMNPKYRIAKRLFGLVFPFERHLGALG